jgi:sec-independent protein translocase protein TatB
MFDFAWSEIALIGVVALVLIGPKDLPVAIKAVTAMIKKARRMAAEFQTHVDDMVKEADLHEVRDQIREFRSLDIRGTIARAVDDDGSIRKAFEDPIRTPPPPAVPTVVPPETPPSELLPETVVEARPEFSVETPATPAFIPPVAAKPEQPVPAFIPPEAGRSPRI